MLILRLTLISVSVNLTLNLFWERSTIEVEGIKEVEGNEGEAP